MPIFNAIVNIDNTVSVFIDGNEVDHPGPWNTTEGAHLWAAAIIASLEAGDIHYACQKETNSPDA